MKPVLYIAGPMYGLPEKNYPAFQHAEKVLTEAGFSVISPLEADRFVSKNDPEPSREWWQRTTLKLLLNAEALALLDSWENSKGAMLEWQVAQGLSMETKFWEDWLL
jgi:nucleoside 2-deoxyribosyltransferase